ncbi:sensor histidine kinase [Amnibacterium sp.]|uniref:sensor histidine kinase n=1 Tax=Amnibacterium sp. TaxID=1872496 RepID=UPI003F7C726C
MAAGVDALQTRPGVLARLGTVVVTAVRWVGRLRGDRVLPGAALLAAVVLVLVETFLVAAPYLPLPLAFAIVIVHVGAVPVALRIPNVAAPLSLVAALTLQWLSAGTGSMLWPWSPVLIVTQCLVLGAVAARTTLPVALLHWLIAVVLSAVLAAVLRPASGDETSADVAVFGSISAALIVVALLLLQWRRVRSELVHERRMAAEEAERRLLAEERTRIARELHDVVAHSLSIITVQSSTARFRHQGFSPEAAAEFDRIAAQSREALDEMRGLLRVLRGADEDAERRPQPGLLDVEELVAQAHRAGTSIVFEQPAGPWTAGVGPLTGLTAYRIAQEAMSNAIRHAPGSDVVVALARMGDDITVSVVNTATGEPAVDSRSGHGLVGMTERAAIAGGTVRFGPTEEGGFAVEARLPVFVRSGVPA